MYTRRITILFLAGILLTSMVAFPYVTFLSELSDDTRDFAIRQDSTQNGFEPAEDLHDYFVETFDDGYWLDAKANGENLSLSGSTDYTTYFMQFNFPFYDEMFDFVYISNCGYLSFADSTPTDVNSPNFPSTAFEHTLTVAPYWDFLPASNNVFAWNTSEYLVVQYDHAYIMAGPEVGTFQVVLYANGTIDFNYLEILYNEDPTVGLNHGDGVHYNLFPYGELDGVTDFTIRFNYYHDQVELSVTLDGPVYTEIGSTYMYNATVKNLGLWTATGIDLMFYLDDIIVNSTVIASLAQAENFT
ncbi:MAG: hypothetical protein RTU92_00210, partial [Candidatus Thorarchaeota archaeon]